MHIASVVLIPISTLVNNMHFGATKKNIFLDNSVLGKISPVRKEDPTTDALPLSLSLSLSRPTGHILVGLWAIRSLKS